MNECMRKKNKEEERERLKQNIIVKVRILIQAEQKMRHQDQQHVEKGNEYNA